jgi:hypothetical protein
MRSIVASKPQQWKTQSKRKNYEQKQSHLQDLVESGDVEESDAEAILDLCDPYDSENTVVTSNDASNDANRWGTERPPSTLRQWMVSLVGSAEDLDGSSTDANADEMNQVTQRMYDVEVDTVTKPLSKNTVRSPRNCLKKFLRHADTAANADDQPI